MIAELCGCRVEDVCAAFVEQGLRNWREPPPEKGGGTLNPGSRLISLAITAFCDVARLRRHMVTSKSTATEAVRYGQRGEIARFQQAIELLGADRQQA